MKKTLRACLISIAFIASTSGMMAFPQPAQAASTTITVSAPAQVNAGQTFSVTISVAPGQAIAGVQCDLDYNASLITATGTAEGGLLKSTGAATYFNPGNIGGGSVTSIAGAIVTPGKNVSGAGTFATVTFVAGAAGGTSALTLSGVVIGDINASPVTFSSSGTQVAVVGTTTNHAPVLNNIGDMQAEVGQTLTFTVSATDADGDSLTYSASGLPQGASFNSSSRVFSWTPGANQTGSYPGVTFQVSDGKLTDSEAITIIVTNTVTTVPATTTPATTTPASTTPASTTPASTTPASTTPASTTPVTTSPTNRAPVLNYIGDKQVVAGQALAFTVSATDPDGDPVSLSVMNLPGGATFNASTGIFAWTPGAGQAGNYPGIIFQASDGKLTASETITISVTPGGTNVPPGAPEVLAVSGISLSGLNNTAADIDWITNLPATGQVQYWLEGSSYKQMSALSGDLSIQHSISLSGLTPGSLYHFIVTSAIDASTPVSSGDNTFETTGSAATFEVSGLSVAPGEVNVGRASSVSVVVNNTGGLSGDYLLVLMVDGSVYANKTVNVTAGGSETVTFAVTIDRAGAHNLSAGNKSVSLMVNAPVVSWELLSIIIGGALLISALIIIIMLYRRQRMKRMLI